MKVIILKSKFHMTPFISYVILNHVCAEDWSPLEIIIKTSWEQSWIAQNLDQAGSSNWYKHWRMVVNNLQMFLFGEMVHSW